MRSEGQFTYFVTRLSKVVKGRYWENWSNLCEQKERYVQIMCSWKWSSFAELMN